MFLGQFHYTLDDKGRMTVPVRYREHLKPDGAYVMQGFDQNLLVFPSAKFLELSHRMNQMNITDPTARLLRRMVFSSADRIELDKSGRILIPVFLRQHAGLSNGLVLVGMGDHFEIWSEDKWKNQGETIFEAQSNPDRFAALDLAIP